MRPAARTYRSAPRGVVSLVIRAPPASRNDATPSRLPPTPAPHPEPIVAIAWRPECYNERHLPRSRGPWLSRPGCTPRVGVAIRPGDLSRGRGGRVWDPDAPRGDCLGFSRGCSVSWVRPKLRGGSGLAGQPGGGESQPGSPLGGAAGSASARKRLRSGRDRAARGSSGPRRAAVVFDGPVSAPRPAARRVCGHRARGRGPRRGKHPV